MRKSIIKELAKHKFYTPILITGLIIMITFLSAIIGFAFGFNLGQTLLKLMRLA